MSEERRNPISELSVEEKNKIIGDAIDAWLDRKWAAFGKWTARGVGAAIFSVVMYYLATHGVQK